MMNLNKISIKPALLVCVLIFFIVGCATEPKSKYILLPKDIFIDGIQHECFHSISTFTSKPIDFWPYSQAFRGLTIAYICQGNDNLELIVGEQDYEYNEALINAYHTFRDSGNVSIPIGGKTWFGTTWDGTAILKKDDPQYPAAFGSLFQENLPKNLRQNNCCLIKEIYVWKRAKN